MPIIQTKSCQCAQCGHIWIPGEWRRDESCPLPRWCPKCKSARWNEGQVERKVVQAGDKPIVERKVKPIVAPIEEQSPANEAPEITKLIEQGKVSRGMNQAIDMTLSLSCPHKKKKGELCYKCDKKFGLPVIKTGS